MKHLLYYKESISDLRSIEDEVKSLYYILEDENITIDDEFRFTTPNTKIVRIYFQPNWISNEQPKYLYLWTQELNKSEELKEFLCRLCDICNDSGFRLYKKLSGEPSLTISKIKSDDFKMEGNCISIMK